MRWLWLVHHAYQKLQQYQVSNFLKQTLDMRSPQHFCVLVLNNLMLIIYYLNIFQLFK